MSTTNKSQSTAGRNDEWCYERSVEVYVSQEGPEDVICLTRCRLEGSKEQWDSAWVNHELKII